MFVSFSLTGDATGFDPPHNLDPNDGQAVLTHHFTLLYSRGFPLPKKVVDAAARAAGSEHGLTREELDPLVMAEIVRIRALSLENETGQQEPMPPLSDQVPVTSSKKILKEYIPKPESKGKAARALELYQDESDSSFHLRQSYDDETYNAERPLKIDLPGLPNVSLTRSHPPSDGQKRNLSRSNHELQPPPKVHPPVLRSLGFTLAPAMPMVTRPEHPKQCQGVKKGAKKFIPTLSPISEEPSRRGDANYRPTATSSIQEDLRRLGLSNVNP